MLSLFAVSAPLALQLPGNPFAQLPNPFATQPAVVGSIPPAAVEPLEVCRSAARSKSEDPEAVCAALLEVEQVMRAAAKEDGGALSRATLDKLDGSWRLVFTTGTIDTQNIGAGSLPGIFPRHFAQAVCPGCLPRHFA